MCKIIVMANQKGGVAKTSSTRNLAYSLAEMGQRVLAVDFDPQTNLTISFGIAPATVKESTASLMMKMLMDEALPDILMRIFPSWDMAELETAFEQSAEEEPEQGMEV